MTTTDLKLLPRSASAEVGIPASSVLCLLEGLATAGLELHSLMVVRRGHVAVEGWWAPYSAERPHLLYSLSKSFTSTAVGLALAEGRFTLDDTIVSLLPGHVPDDVDPAVATLTVHHLLSMSTGHHEDTLERARVLEPDDFVRGFLRVPPQEAVGSRHVYHNSCTYVLAALVQELTGEHLLDYLRPRLLDPLGVGPAHWDNDIHGNALGFTGLHLGTEAIAAFGQLLLQRGEWHGEQLLPAGWVELATRKHIDTDLDPATNVDWAQGYGYQYWMSRHGFRGDGAYGQFCLVVPEQDLVVVTTACVEDMQAILTAVWTHLLPALDTADPDRTSSDGELARRLAGLALPVINGAPDGALRRARGPVNDQSFIVQEGGELAPLAAGTRIEIRPAGGDGWTITLVSGESRLVFGCGHHSWVESAPVVARGGWTAPDTFEADLVLIELPHRIRLRCTDGRAEASWNAPPLSRPRLEAHLP